MKKLPNWVTTEVKKSKAKSDLRRQKVELINMNCKLKSEL